MMKRKLVVEFLKCCVSCLCVTDLVCVSCENWFCSIHLNVCVQCQQPVCKECYLNDLCCLVRPWGEKTQLHLRGFYENNVLLLSDVLPLSRRKLFFSQEREDACLKCLEKVFDEMDATAFRDRGMFGGERIIASYFPRIGPLLKKEGFVGFLKALALENADLFASLLFHSQDRGEVIEVVKCFLTVNDNVMEAVARCAVANSGKKGVALFRCLNGVCLLDFQKLQKSIKHVNHIEAFKWLEANGINVLENIDHFKRYVNPYCVDIMRYLLLEKKMKTEYMLHHVNLKLREKMLQMVLEVKGAEHIRKFSVDRIFKDMGSMRVLRQCEYEFDKQQCLEKPLVARELCSLLCYNVLSTADLQSSQKEEVKVFVNDYDIVCKAIFIFMKNVRKKKVLNAILCMKQRKIPTEIVWIILGEAFSGNIGKGKF